MSSQIYQEVPGTSSRAARIRYSPPPGLVGAELAPRVSRA
jgi:hypothetical protein